MTVDSHTCEYICALFCVEIWVSLTTLLLQRTHTLFTRSIHPCQTNSLPQKESLSIAVFFSDLFCEGACSERPSDFTLCVIWGMFDHCLQSLPYFGERALPTKLQVAAWFWFVPLSLDLFVCLFVYLSSVISC